jgi:lysophospholipase L1-like esterase
LPSLLEEWTHHGPPSIVTLCLGANDSALLTGDSDRQHVPLTEYKQNMQEILLSMRKAAPECIIILMTPPPVDDFIRAKSHTPIDRCDKAVKEYAEICLELGTTLTLPVIDLYQEFHSVGETWPSLFCDGLHFSTSGNHKVYELIKKTIDEKYPQWKSSILPWQLPDHKSFN